MTKVTDPPSPRAHAGVGRVWERDYCTLCMCTLCMYIVCMSQ